ncbi:MAG: hypothetical protein K2L28_09140, partial [Muribaculaceae bacterium]|nr:hypothetical protein [Muribaculaceae bacterium]
FKGLPGLILMVSDSSGCHEFVATGLEYTTESLPKMEVPEYYSKGNRIDFLRNSSVSIERTISRIRAMSAGADIKLNVSGVGELGAYEIDDYLSSFDPDYRGLETDY